MKCALPLEQTIRPTPCAIANIRNGTGAQGTSTFRVWGFHPLLRVAVHVYFEVKTNRASFGGNQTWTARGIKKTPSGDVRTLQAIFTNQSLEDGREFNSGAEGIEFVCTFGDMLAATPSGTWMVEVTAMPEAPMDADLFCALAAQVKVEPPQSVPTYFPSIT